MPDPMIAGSVGILPCGALGVGFFFQLTQQLTQVDGQVFFLERAGSGSMAALRQAGVLTIGIGDRVERIPLERAFRGILVGEAGALPQVLLVCPNPDQLTGVIDSYVGLMEALHQRGDLASTSLPIVVLCANGIYFQQIRQVLVEKLEESTLFGRLPDLWPDLMPRIVTHLLRGVTLQTGVRQGSGAETIYYPGPRGLTRIAGGDPTTRQRCQEILSRRGGWFDLAPEATPTRLEFEKALINLSSNLLGQLYAIDATGSFRPLTVEQIFLPEREPDLWELIGHLHQVGCAVRAYRPEESVECLYDQLQGIRRAHASHVPSSLQWVDLKLRLGQLKPELTPTEAWLLDPLIRFAHSAHLEDAARYFEGLRSQLLEKLHLAAERSRPIFQRSYRGEAMIGSDPC